MNIFDAGYDEETPNQKSTSDPSVQSEAAKPARNDSDGTSDGDDDEIMSIQALIRIAETSSLSEHALLVKLLVDSLSKRVEVLDAKEETLLDSELDEADVELEALKESALFAFKTVCTVDFLAEARA